MNTQHLRAVLLPMGLIAHFAGASALNLVQVFVTPAASGGTGPFQQTIQLPGTLNTAGSATGGFNSSGSGSAHAEYGVAFVRGEAHVTLDTGTHAGFSDTITITSPLVANGTIGSLTYRVRVSGLLSATSGSSAASWKLIADIGGGASDISKQATFYAPHFFNSGYVGDPFGTYSATVSFQFGASMPLRVQLDGSASARIQSSEFGECRFGGPLKANWEGITSITVGGSPVSVFSITSESGTDWRGTIDFCPGDFNNDGAVDDADFTLFVGAYNILDCADPAMPAGCPADLNADGIVDDADFVIFVVAYEALLCP